MRAGVKTEEKLVGQHDRTEPPLSLPRWRGEERRGESWATVVNGAARAVFYSMFRAGVCTCGLSLSSAWPVQKAAREAWEMPPPLILRQLSSHFSPYRSPCSFFPYLPFSALARFLAD